MLKQPSRRDASLGTTVAAVLISSVVLVACDQSGTTTAESSGQQPGAASAGSDTASGPITSNGIRADGQTRAAPGPATSLTQGQRILPIVVQPAEMDLGLIPPGTVAMGEVEIMNIGTDPVTIVTSKSSCTCTTVDLANTIIQPNEIVTLPAEFDGGYQLGNRTATISLIFEGFDDVVKVPVRAEVALSVRAEPSRISHQVPRTQEFAERVEYTLASVDGAPFRVLAVQGEQPPFVDFDPDSDEARNAYRLVFDFTRYDEQTCIDEEGRRMPPFLAIETDHPGCPILSMRVRHECTMHERPEPGQDWALAHRSTLLGELWPNEAAEFSVPLRWRPGAQVASTIREVVSESPQFAAKLLEEYEESGTLWYRVQITPAAHHRGLLYGRVRFQSDAHDMAMTVIGVVRDPGDEGS